MRQTKRTRWRAVKIFRRFEPTGDASLRDLIGTFTRNGAVDDEIQRNDLDIIRQLVNGAERCPDARAYDFTLETDRQLTKAGLKP